MSEEQENNEEQQLNKGLAELSKEEVRVLFNLIGSALQGETTIEVRPAQTEFYESLLDKGFLVTDNNGTTIANKVADIICNNLFLLALSPSVEAIKENAEQFDNTFKKASTELSDPTQTGANITDDTLAKNVPGTSETSKVATNNENLAAGQSPAAGEQSGQDNTGTVASTEETTTKSETAADNLANSAETTGVEGANTEGNGITGETQQASTDKAEPAAGEQDNSAGTV